MEAGDAVVEEARAKLAALVVKQEEILAHALVALDAIEGQKRKPLATAVFMGAGHGGGTDHPFYGREDLSQALPRGHYDVVTLVYPSNYQCKNEYCTTCGGKK